MLFIITEFYVAYLYNSRQQCSDGFMVLRYMIYYMYHLVIFVNAIGIMIILEYLWNEWRDSEQESSD